MNSAIKSVNLYMASFAASDHDERAAQQLKGEVENLQEQVKEMLKLDLTNCAALDTVHLEKLADSLTTMISPSKDSAFSVMNDFV